MNITPTTYAYITIQIYKCQLLDNTNLLRVIALLVHSRNLFIQRLMLNVSVNHTSAAPVINVVLAVIFFYDT